MDMKIIWCAGHGKKRKIDPAGVWDATSLARERGRQEGDREFKGGESGIQEQDWDFQ